MAYADLLELIEAHPVFGPRLRRALAEGFELVLDYHRHPDAERWCVSFHARVSPAAELHELAHVKDFGSAREDCVPLLGPLATELLARYRLERAPHIHLEGAPFRGL